MALIIYGTQYGTSKQYAEQLATITGDSVIDSRHLPKELPEAHVIFVGSVYAGRMTGLKKVLQVLAPERNELTVVTVGMTDARSEELVAGIHQPIAAKVAEKKISLRGCYHLQGKVNYDGLALKHKLVIKPMVAAFKKKPANELDEQAKMLLRAFDQTNANEPTIDFAALAERMT
ncbi:MAG: flavodoxin domain-containing protein [Enterococcus viikkiensis]|uniref:flavodoxin domain-containing protein n=1 Tax=Enterococcus viikkiensis TaxID=930854 RepID=UPI003F8E9563